jgi:YjbE family integral membrane protein
VEIFTLEFLSALFAIIMIDLVLAGDNAIVIAMAARNLPANLQKRAIIWGAVGAICVRSVMTLVVVYLLKIPGLILAGGVLLVWIAYRLLNSSEAEDSEHSAASMTFWGAMKTIIIADAVMGLDNVLAVAGAAQGSYLLVVLGLLISIPIVVWGSTQILQLVEKYPQLIYFGAGILTWTAIKMIISEPLIQEYIPTNDLVVYGIYIVGIFLVLYAGYLKNKGFSTHPIHSNKGLVKSNSIS